MNTDKMLDVSAIICTYAEERWDDLAVAVESLQKQIIPPREIIVVVDHNVRLFQRTQAQMLGIVVTENHEERGLSGARNHGIAIATSTFVAFLDDDAVAEPDWLLRLSQHCEDPKVLGAGGAVDPLWLCKRPAWFPEEFYWVVGCSYLGLPQVLSEVRNPYGGCACFRREVFEVAGGFRVGIGRAGSRPLGGEETELCIRARQRWPHRVFLYDPQAKIHHRIPPSRSKWHYFRSRCYAEGLSKALITKYVGARASLASERGYTLTVLLLGVVRSLMNSFLHFDKHEFLRACAIVCGLAITTLGFVVGLISGQVAWHKQFAISSNHNFKEPLQESLHLNN